MLILCSLVFAPPLEFGKHIQHLSMAILLFDQWIQDTVNLSQFASCQVN